jgi:hypothetical protein
MTLRLTLLAFSSIVLSACSAGSVGGSSNACTASCAGRSCGGDGCGGSCGSCAGSQVCSADGACSDPLPGCTPDCSGKNCGGDGCNGNCGSCTNPQVCSAGGMCNDPLPSCTPACSGKTCGDDGCGGNCGTCTSPQVCSVEGVCQDPTPGCTRACSGKNCGDDGCGGTCGGCTLPQTCSVAGVCTAPSCTPSCSGKTCGSDGCSGTCGTCISTQICSAASTCVAAPTGSVSVDATAGNRPIHPEIYGVAFASKAAMQAVGATINRFGGNTTSTYNWQIDVHNTGLDWYFENIPDGTGAPSGSVDALITAARGAGGQALITIPTLGVIPKAPRVANHPYVCSFPKTTFPTQDSFDPYDTNCGNGVKGGVKLTTTASVSFSTNTPAFQSEWVTHLTSTFGTAASGGVRFYQLDNETNLWSSTHRDAHPAPTTYDEIWKATVDYGTVIKQIDPGAVVLGYGTWGVLDLWYSALDSANKLSDQGAHGGTLLARWYMQQLATYDSQHGGKLVDCLDLHYYPQGGNGLANTASLWDPTYPDPSWINGWLGQPVRLFPRLAEWIAQDYPGMDVCVSEYSFNVGNDTDPKSAIIEADTLGIFGKYGVRLGAFWGSVVDSAGKPLPSGLGLAVYRNYDGAGGRFGDVSVSAASTITGVSAFAATRSSDGALTVLILNKDATAQTVPVTVSGFAAGAAAKVWSYQATAGATITAKPDLAVTAGAVSVSMPAYSMTLLVLPKS